MRVPNAVRLGSAALALLIPLTLVTPPAAVADTEPHHKVTGSGGAWVPPPGTDLERTPEEEALLAKKLADVAELTRRLQKHDYTPDLGKLTRVTTNGTAGRRMVKGIPLVTQKQRTPYFCVPASVRAMLSRFVPSGSLPTQGTLAFEMGTRSDAGTPFPAAPATLNRHLGRSFYVADFTTSSGVELLNRTVSDVGVASAGLMLRMPFMGTPWRQGPVKTGHATVVHGYDYIDQGDENTNRWLTIWDPIDDNDYRAPLASSWKSLNDGGRWMVW